MSAPGRPKREYRSAQREGTPVSMRERNPMHRHYGVGLIEVMISIIIAMLLVLVIYQVYEISESQKRTITGGSDAQQNASYAMYALGRDLAMAGNGIASAATDPSDPAKPVLFGCAMLRPIPVLIEAGADPEDPDTITVLYGGSAGLSTPVQFKQTATTSAAYIVPGPVGFSPNDVIVAVQGANCTLSTINAGGVAVDSNTGFATLTHTRVAGADGVTYAAVAASLVNLGQPASMGRVAYTVDTTGRVLRTQNQLPTNGPVSPVINDVQNLKAQYGLDTDNDGAIDAWQDPTGDTWSAANLPNQPLATLRQIRAVRIAIVTRSAQYEKEALRSDDKTVKYDAAKVTIKMLDDTVTMTLATEDDTHYRYKVLETVVPLRNALWNAP